MLFRGNKGELGNPLLSPRAAFVGLGHWTEQLSAHQSRVKVISQNRYISKFQSFRRKLPCLDGNTMRHYGCPVDFPFEHPPITWCRPVTRSAILGETSPRWLRWDPQPAPLQQWRRDFCHLENPKKETMNFPSAWHSKQGNPFSVTMDDTSHVLGRFHDFKWNDIIARVLGALHQG